MLTFSRCIISNIHFLFLELLQFGGVELLQIASDIWRPLTVEIGAFGSLTGISKLAANVIGPLADENVSVFCLSTNQEDYVMVNGFILSFLKFSLLIKLWVFL